MRRTPELRWFFRLTIQSRKRRSWISRRKFGDSTVGVGGGAVNKNRGVGELTPPPWGGGRRGGGGSRFFKDCHPPPPPPPGGGAPGPGIYPPPPPPGPTPTYGPSFCHV